MKRRDLIEALLGAAAVPNLGACDRLVVLATSSEALLAPVTATEDHYVYSAFRVPDVDAATHQTNVTMDGEVLAVFDRDFVESLLSRDKTHTLQCIGSSPTYRAIGNAIWTGLPLIEVFEALGVAQPSHAEGLKFVGADANFYTGEVYDVGLPASDFKRIWLVWGMNGERLSAAHGAPYRLLVPDRYGVKNVKWPVEIGFTSRPFESFWTQFGWNEDAFYQANTLVLRPAEGTAVTAGQRLRVAGCAFAGTDPVASVEVSVDRGPWRSAEVFYEGVADQWMLWTFDWLVEEGTHTLQARCTTAGGAPSSPQSEGTDPLHGYDGSMSITVST